MEPAVTISRRAALLWAAAWPLAAQAFDFKGLFSTQGSGRQVHRELELESFDTIRLGGDIALELVQGQPPRVLIDTDDDVLPQIEVVAGDGVLTVRRTGRLAPTRQRIVVQVWSLQRIELAGSATVSAAELVSKRLALDLSGAASVRIGRLTAESLIVQAGGSVLVSVGGRANELRATLGGSSALQAADFQVRRVGVTLGGSAAARVWAEDTLDGAVGGSSTLRYRGEPKVGVVRGGSAVVARLP
jgi:hypothetical protein